MKYLYFIFAVYVFMLSSIPCNESETQDCKRISSISYQHAHQHQEESDDCSPFCQCACCQGTILVVSKIIITPVTLSLSPLCSHYSVGFTPQVLNSIWQPP